MAIFRKKPVEIEARQFITNNDDGSHLDSLVGWITYNGHTASHNGTDLFIETLEGTMRAECRDWIIKGVKGEFYPCKPHIFEASYDSVINESVVDELPLVEGRKLREITKHGTNVLNKALTILVVDEPGVGNACHHYRIEHSHNGPACDAVDIKFQKGAILEAGEVNGISIEALLAIVEDRLADFQSGPFACAESNLALASVQEALMWLTERTKLREARGVEGTHTI